MTFSVDTRRLDAHGSLARCKEASISLDTDVNGRTDAFKRVAVRPGAAGRAAEKPTFTQLPKP
jgi:hypothetical protein